MFMPHMVISEWFEPSLNVLLDGNHIIPYPLVYSLASLVDLWVGDPYDAGVPWL